MKLVRCIKKYNNYFFSNNDSGSATVISLLILAALTIIGLAATQTSQMELSIVGNEKLYKQNFNMAEASAKEIVKIMDLETNQYNLNPDISSFGWLNPTTSGKDFSQSSDWEFSGNGQNAQSSVINASASNAVIFQGIDPSSSLSMTKSGKVHIFSVYGMSQIQNGTVIIDMGYRKRF